VAAKPQPRAVAPLPVVAAAVLSPVHSTAHDQKPFRKAAVKARSERRKQAARGLAPGHAKAKHKEVSVLPPSRARTHDLKPVHATKPHVAKVHVNHGHAGGGTHGNGNGGGSQGHGHGH
jgi:hypothetical protein